MAASLGDWDVERLYSEASPLHFPLAPLPSCHFLSRRTRLQRTDRRRVVHRLSPGAGRRRLPLALRADEPLLFVSRRPAAPRAFSYPPDRVCAVHLSLHLRLRNYQRLAVGGDGRLAQTPGSGAKAREGAVRKKDLLHVPGSLGFR